MMGSPRQKNDGLQLQHRQSILIVDDMPTNIAVLAEAFSQEYDVMVATTGKRALELAFRSPPPDLILMDIIMPGLNGFDVCRRLKNNESTKDIPLIFITAKSDPEDEALGLSIGAADYVTKPFHLAIVKSRVKTHLNLKKKSDMLEILASRDGLTGLPNRRSFDERLSMEWGRAVRRGSTLGMIMMDIDQFKLYNDNYGHRQGDDCLQQVGQTIALSLERADDFVARYGGEEFVAIVPDTSPDHLEAVAKKIRVMLRNAAIPHAYSTVSPVVTLSLGAGCCNPSKKNNIRSFIEFTDRLLYQAKAEGRDRWRFQFLDDSS